ncbi:diaminopimelate epimerase [Lutibacter sp. B2]|nr:diaminopimelate epimerase [Lutibacter sp. B2]
MKLNFIKTNPTENMTVFVADQIPRSKHIKVAQKIMNYNSIYAEQVGFIEKPMDENSEACARLQMMGGEFCGNATRALAATLVYKEYCEVENDGKKVIVPLEVSGADNIICCEVEPINNRSFRSTASMPLHKGIKDFSIAYNGKVYGGILVEFPGIAHLVIDSKDVDSKKMFFQAVKNHMNISEYDALGIMFYKEEESYIEPLVYVKETDSLIWERGCGSGSSAVAIALSYKYKKGVDVIINQPGGELQVITKWMDDQVVKIHLSGIVHIVAEGIVHL